MKRYLPFIIIAVVGLATLGGATALYRANKPPSLTLNNEGEVKGQNVHIRGQTTAPVTLEEYGDFQCPPCGMLAPVVKQFEKDFDPHLRVIFHNFPLINHSHAKE